MCHHRICWIAKGTDLGAAVKRVNQSELYWAEPGDFNTKFHQMSVSFHHVCERVIAQWVFTSPTWGSVHTCTVHVITGDLRVETLRFDILSCFLFFFLNKCFPLWHVVFISPDSVNLWVVCLICSARVMFSKAMSGNFFQCVIEGDDNHRFSISTCSHDYHTEGPSAHFTSVLHYANCFNLPSLNESVRSPNHSRLLGDGELYLGKIKGNPDNNSFSLCRFESTLVSAAMLSLF